MTPFWLYVIWVGFTFLFCFWSISMCWCWQYTHQGGDYKHKVDMCLCVSSLWWVIVGDDRLLLSLETNHGVSLCVQHVFWLCWCVGVEHRDGRWTWRRSSRDVSCQWTMSGEGWTWGLDRGTKTVGRLTMGGWYLGASTSKSTCGGVDRVDQVKRRRWRTWWSSGQGRRRHMFRSWRRQSRYASSGGLVVLGGMWRHH